MPLSLTCECTRGGIVVKDLCVALQTVTELGPEGQPPPTALKPRVSSAKVTSSLRRSQSTTKAPSPSPPSPADPSHQQALRLLCNTDSLFETLESHQVSVICTSQLERGTAMGFHVERLTFRSQQLPPKQWMV